MHYSSNLQNLESYFTYGPEEESPVDHDVHFRPGLGADGTETFMPRTVIYDLKGGFGSLRKINALYDAGDDPSSSSLWGGQTVIQRQQPIEPSPYQASLDAGLAAPGPLAPGDVRYWSDFNRVFFHPRSAVQLNEYELNSAIMPFERWRSGEELFAALDREHDIADRDLRPFVEEADRMQGLQVMAGLDDAWGGFAARYVERLRDEYGKIPIWVWGVQDPVGAGLPREKRLLRLVNKARALVELNSQATLIVPLALPRRPLPPGVRVDPSSPWSVTGLLAAALESTTLYTRLRATDGANSSSLGNVADLLNVFGKQTIANLEMSVVEPSPRNGDASGLNGGPAAAAVNGRGAELFAAGRDAYAREEDVSESGSRDGGGAVSLDIDLSSPEELDLNGPGGRRSSRKRHVFSQFLTYRGPENPEFTGGNEGEAQLQAQRGGYTTRRQPKKVHNYHSALGFPILDSYPQNLLPTLSELGGGDGGGGGGGKAAVRTALSVDSSVAAKVRGLRGAVVRSVGLEDREAVDDELADIAERYREGWSSGSDDDDDD
ncbi:hypothetical protein DL766_006415 [Monosporascus sp. MC13-8B]|nr:hypothetical protein DL763_011316 [Monosporascus cannonballus]RYP27418.1 hypothetical protein DL766_006415 [Monosporascus sp. MC13-8B]